MEHNFGTDLIITSEGDLTLAPNGDFLDTDTYQETNASNYSFDGEVCVRESLYRVITYLAGEYSVFDIESGAGANQLVSKPFLSSEFELFKERLERQLQKDDRIEFVEDISFEKIDTNIYKISISIKMVGKDKTSSFVFPYSSS